MRITNQWKYAQTMFDYQRGMKGVQKHNMQLSSGLKIQNSYEAAGTYNDAMRLDYEITALDQVVEATSKSQNFAKNTDKSLQEFSRQLEKFKVKLIQAASDIHSPTSLGALANDLEGIKDHLMNIANTSINGQFLFAGSAVDTKPISSSGSYHGNREEMKTISGSKIEIPFNLNGYDLFLGKDFDYHKKLTTNVRLIDQTKPNPEENPKILTEDSTIKEMIGLNYVIDRSTINSDYDFLKDEVKFPDTYFYMQGRKPSGETFTSKFRMTSETTIRTVLDKVGVEFGNTPNTKVVDVTINNDGHIVVKDLTKGNQNLDMNLVAFTEKARDKDDLQFAIGRDATNSSKADQENFEALKQSLRVDRNIHMTEFTKNKFSSYTDSFVYDRVGFDLKDNTLTGNISQVVRKSGEFATDSTRLSEVAGTKDLYPNYKDRYNIDGKKLGLEIKSISGINYEVSVAFEHDNGGHVNFNVIGKKNGRQVFPTPTATNPNPLPKGFNVWHATSFGQFQTNAADFTFRQLNDIVGMIASDKLPINDTFEAYNKAIDTSRGVVDVSLNHRGQIVLKDKTKSVTDLELKIFDSTPSNVIIDPVTGRQRIDPGTGSGSFVGDSTTKQGVGSIFSFMENNAVTLDEPTVDIFRDLNKMIKAVRKGQNRADADSEDPRNTGIQGAIERIDHIMDHINKEKVKIGSHTNLLQDTNNRASLMKVNVASIKSEVIDADYAESYLSLTQKMMSYQAMLQATSKINQLSLLNYLN